MENRTQLDIPALTFLKIFVAIAVAFALIKLFPLLLIVALAILLASAVHPVVVWLTEHGVKRGLALGLMIFLLIGTIAFAVVFLIPQIFSQISNLGENLGALKKQVLEQLPEGQIRLFAQHSMNSQGAITKNMPALLGMIGSFAAFGLYQIALFLILSVYFLIDGDKAYQWLVTFFQPETQKKIGSTVADMQKIVFAYVGGQVITSVAVGIYVFIVNTALGVPGALMLAAIAAACDILPVIGFLTSTFIAVAMAVTVSPQTALIVMVCYLGYQVVENYLIVPSVYGRRMQLSTLVVLLSFLVAGAIAGIPGAVLALPIVAAYPVIEKIWLKKYLGAVVVEKHKGQLRESSTSQQKSSGEEPLLV